MSDETNDNPDRRDRPRTAVAVELELLAPDLRANAPSRTINLSSGGAFVRTRRPLPVGTKIKVAFYRGKQRNPLTLDAVVVRAPGGNNGQSEGMALQFTGLTDLDENLVADLIVRARS